MITKKIPVSHSVRDVISFLNERRDCAFILYLAHKNRVGWARSTSRVYMNEISPKLLYLPVDIAKNDLHLLRQIYALAKRSRQIIAINQTQPHKSNPVLRKLFRRSPLTNIDSIIKRGNTLVPYSLNATAFLSWYESDVGSLKNSNVIIIGVGGTGEPIARQLITHKLKTLFLIDPVNKKKLAAELSSITTTYYRPRITNELIEQLNGTTIVINASGKEGAENGSSIQTILTLKTKGIYVDLRPQLELKQVLRAKKLRWRAYTGFGMNVLNDYRFLTMAVAGRSIHLPPVARFKTLVRAAS